VSDLHERPISIDSGGLRLEGMLHEGSAPVAALVLHPHPQYGGDMHNHVVVAMCEALAGRGATTLRFNFRGAGASQGAFDGGAGEASDAVAAAKTLRGAAPGARLLLAGYSFGAMVAAGAAADVAPDALALVSPPLGFSPLAAFPAGLQTLLATGDSDPISPAAGVRALAAPNLTAAVVAGVDHSWWPGLEQLVTELHAFSDSLTPPLFDA
jgi:uncharacterized protein